MKTEYRDNELYLVEKPVKVVFKDEYIEESDDYTIVRLDICRV